MPQLELIRAKVQTVKSVEGYYSSTRINIQSSGRDLKVTTLASAQLGEGKSTTSVNPAISPTRAGFRTLLIDADTRDSVMSGTLKPNECYQRLASFLFGSAELSDVIYDIDTDNPMIIPAGQAPPNPTSLIQNDNLKATIEIVHGLYDYVIIDTPLLGSVIDAAILAYHSDANLLMTKAGEDRHRTATKLKEQLEQSGSAFLGVILSKYDIHLDKYGSYGSYGGYGSCGSYGKSEEKIKIGRDKRRK